MAESRSKPRKQVFQDYYTEEDYKDITKNLPEIVKAAEKRKSETLEPTIFEKRDVMKHIRNFIRKKGRKVYGGTAINELIHAVNKNDGIYDKDCFSDIEFYSSTPIEDLIELTTELYKAGFKHVEAAEAQHIGTYKIFVNFAPEYCDITQVSGNVERAIKTIEIDGIQYVHPHFIHIDQLRIFNDPMTSAYIWEKTFERAYKLLKYYPFELFNGDFTMPKIPIDIKEYQNKIQSDFLSLNIHQTNNIVCGFSAYNYFIKTAAKDPNVDKMARIVRNKTNLTKLEVEIPFIDIVSIDYKQTIIALYEYLMNNVADVEKLSKKEYYPLFQFTGNSVVFLYDNIPLIRIYEYNDMCIPYIKMTSGRKIGTFQYILMWMLINKFHSFILRDEHMYKNYGSAISNMIQARNQYLDSNNFSVLDKTPFGEFRLGCIGTTMSFERRGRLRKQKRIEQGKPVVYRYKPEDHVNKETNKSEKKFTFPIASGREIPIKYIKFRLFPNEKQDETSGTESESDEENEEETENKESTEEIPNFDDTNSNTEDVQETTTENV